MFFSKNMQKQEWQHNVQTPIFFFPFFLFFAVLGITLRFSGWMFQPTGAISYTCQPCIFFLYCIHLRNTPLHILVLVPSSQFVSNSAFYFFCSYWGKSWMVTVNRFVMQSDPSVCVCFEIIRTTWTVTEETKGLVTWSRRARWRH